MQVEQLTVAHERELRRWVATRDIDFAIHRQLKDYFLAPTDSFGAAAVRDTAGKIIAVGFFSRYGGKAFIHHFMGEFTAETVEKLRVWLGLPCQAFFKSGQEPTDARWQNVLTVTPGFVVDHPAYDGVFSRVAPRFHGAVYEHPGD